MEIEHYISSFLTVLIASILSIYIFKRFGAGPARSFIITFLFGTGWVLAVILNDFLTSHLINTTKPSIRPLGFYPILMTGFISELGKYLIIKIYAMPKANFKGPIDGIFFALYVALGFSVSSIVWSGMNPFFDDPARWRAIFTFPVNLTTAIFSGFFVGYAKGRKNKLFYLLKGLGASTLFHAVYEFLMLSRNYGLLPVYFTSSMVLVGVLGIKALKIANRRDNAFQN